MGEHWTKNRAIELIRVHLLFPAIFKYGNMLFAPLGSKENDAQHLPTRLISSCTKALYKIFPNFTPQQNRSLVNHALEVLRRYKREGTLASYIPKLESKYLGEPRDYLDAQGWLAELAI